MKKNNSFLYFALFLISFCVGLSLAFSSSFTVYGATTGNTYSYNLDVTENSNSFQIGGISNIEDLSFSYTFVYKFTYTTTSTETVFKFLGSSNAQTTYTGNLFWFNHSNLIVGNSSFLYNVAVRVKDNATGTISLGPNSGSSNTTRKVTLSAGVYDVYFTTGSITGNYNTFNIQPRYQTLSSTGPIIYFGRGRSVSLNDLNDFTNTPLSYLVDNDTSTNFGFKTSSLIDVMASMSGGIPNTNHGDTGFDIKPFNEFYVNNQNINFTLSSYGTISAGFIYNGTTVSTSSLTTWYNITYCNFNFSQITDYSINIVSEQIYFNIHKPVYRFNSSLTFLNYDYLQLLNNVSAVDYTLSRNEDIYNMYYVGTVPNYRDIIFYNNNVKNIQFDEYIDLTLYFSGPINLNVLNLNNLTNEIFTFGFDFNFDQYLNSLVMGDALFDNFDTYKPEYVEMKFSLNPLYLPILEIVQNAFIFLIYDFPIFNEVFAVLGFTNLFNLLVSIFNFISLFFDFSTINFITGIVAFFVSFNILKTLVPIVYSSATGVSSAFVSSSAYSDFKAYNNKYKIIKRNRKLKAQRIKKYYKNRRKAKIKHLKTSYNYDKKDAKFMVDNDFYDSII